MLLDLFEQGLLTEVSSVLVEAEYGYVARLEYKNGAVRLIKGNDVGLNSGAACEIAKDKAYTRFLLERLGYSCPRGGSFVLPWWATLIRRGMEARQGAGEQLAVRDASGAARFARDELGFPVYVKPVDGSKGQGVWRCDSVEQIETVLETYNAQLIRVAVVEEAISLPDHRLVILHGRLISAYRRFPLSVVGDGTAPISELIRVLQERFRVSGRDTRIDSADPRIAMRLERNGRTLDTVPATGEVVQLLDISNLSTGGTAVDMTSLVAPRWRELASSIAARLGLNYCGVDLACEDITAEMGEYYIFEVNASPGLDHYVSVGPLQESIVRNLYAQVLNVPPS